MRTGSERHLTSDLPSEYAATSQDSHPQAAAAAAAATSSGSRKQKASIQAEQVYQQQAVLKQLKELPVKSMNASLLVRPLVDHGNVLNLVMIMVLGSNLSCS